MVWLAAPVRLPAAVGLQLSGAITGIVSDPAGIPQMGATVQLLNRLDKPYARALTDDRGEFRFLALVPDVYSIRVTLAAFVPALKKDILVQPGMRSALSVNLNTLFSTIQLAYPPFENGLMTDDWKWVLRSASSTRPVLRFTPVPMAHPPKRSDHATVFSDTRGIVQLSAGEGEQATGIASQADMGTAFALATSLYGSNNLQVAGNVGYGSQTGAPATALRTSYSRHIGDDTPEFSVTMRQLLLPGRSGLDSGPAALRSVSASFDDQTRLSEYLTLKYGISLDSVSFVDSSSYFSPYALLSYAMDEDSEVDVAYTSGDARPDLAGSSSSDAELQKGLNSLGLFPRLSMLGGKTKVQRGNELEFTYLRKAGSRTFNITAFHEQVSNAALSLVAPDSFYGGDILPDLFSGSAIFNAGNYQSMGYTAGMTQNVGQNVSATLMYGSSGALTVNGGDLVSNNPDELRSMIHAGRKHAATLRISATSPWTGTHMIASYQWTADSRWAVPGNLYSTQAYRAMPGLNIMFRQPIPGFPRRLEATADLRNLLAQGYLPLGVIDGQRVLLVQTPRSFCGGLAFTF
jgi:hypothetical protein